MAFGGPAEFDAGVTVATILAPFFQAALSKAGDDAYLGLKRLTTRLVAFGRGKYGSAPEGGVAFTDGSLRLQFDPRLPDRAFENELLLRDRSRGSVVTSQRFDGSIPASPRMTLRSD
jgi:hypothetical protein